MFNQVASVSWQSIELPYTQSKTSRSPVVGQADRANSQVATKPFGCRLRHDANANTVLHHMTYVLERSHASAEGKGSTSQDSLFTQKFLERVPCAQADKCLPCHLRKCNAAMLGQRIATWNDQNEPVGCEWKSLQRAVIDRVGDDTDFSDAGGHGLDDLRAAPLLQVDDNVLAARKKRRKRFGQKLGHGGRVGP